MTAKRKLPTILCASCGKRKRKKGSIRSRFTDARWCAECVTKEAKRRVSDNPGSYKNVDGADPA